MEAVDHVTEHLHHNLADELSCVHSAGVEVRYMYILSSFLFSRASVEPIAYCLAFFATFLQGVFVPFVRN